MFTFTDKVPAIQGRTYIDKTRAEELLDACIDNPGQWARVPIVWLYPDLEGANEKKLIAKSRSTTGQIRSGTLTPFNEYRCEAKSRVTDLYIRIVLTQRQRRELTE